MYEVQTLRKQQMRGCHLASNKSGYEWMVYCIDHKNYRISVLYTHCYAPNKVYTNNYMHDWCRESNPDKLLLEGHQDISPGWLWRRIADKEEVIDVDDKVISFNKGHSLSCLRKIVFPIETPILDCMSWNCANQQ